MEESASSERSSKRHIKSLRTSNPSIPVGDRWAIIIGISKYKDNRLHLKYAHRDAEEFYKVITKPSGGGFEENHICKLIDEEATRDNINKALRSFLKKPAQDDLVLIYFACHGSYDIDRPHNVYLLPYDTDPDDISGTAVPMREIDASLSDNLLSEKVIIIADACHSASIGKGIGGGRRSTNINSTKVVNRYLENVSKSRGGIALLTSAQSNEVALEDEKWGEGHGVFTYYLLEGMRGNADISPQDGIVTVGELFEYVRENVKKATGNQQHPSVGPNVFDENLPMAITAGITAQEYFQLGSLLYELGLILDDKRRLESANRQFYESIRLTKLDSIPFTEANLQLGKSLMAINDNTKAIETFEDAIDICNRTSTIVPSEMFIYLGMAYSKIQNYSNAINSFKKFLDKNPEDENAQWIKKYIDYLEQLPNNNTNRLMGEKYALLIGVNDNSDSQQGSGYFPNVQGATNDVQEIKRVLIHKFGFVESNITILTEKNKTTKKSIIDAFYYLASIVTPFDNVIIYYAGHTLGNDDAYLIPSDTVIDKLEIIKNSISPGELNFFVSMLFSSTTLIIDSNPNLSFLNLAKKNGKYTLLWGAGLGETSFEYIFENKHHGVFTYFFSKWIDSFNMQNLTYGSLINYIAEKSEEAVKKQTPMLINKNNDAIIFSQQSYYLDLFEFVQLKNYSLYTYSKVQRLYYSLKKHIGTSFPQGYYSFGCAFLEKEKYENAYEALQIAISTSRVQNPKIIYNLAISQLQTKRYNESILSLKQYIQLIPESNGIIEFIIREIKQLSRSQKHALLVGINNYINPEIPKIKGAINDVLVLKKILIEKFNFKEENIIVLLDEQATYNAILKSFKQLLENSKSGPAFFYFSGAGSLSHKDDSIRLSRNFPISAIDEEGILTSIVSVDGRLEDIYDINLEELASLSLNRNLITIIDAGWTYNGDRTVSIDLRSRPITRNIIKPTKEPAILILPRSKFSEKEELNLRIGELTIYSNSIKKLHSSSPIYNESESPSFESSDKKVYHGKLTYAIIKAFIENDTNDMTYSKLIDLISTVKPKIIFDKEDAIIFSNSKLVNKITRNLKAIEKLEVINKAILLLKRLIEQRNDIHPEGYLNLGISYAVQGDYDNGIKFIEKAIVQKNNFYPEASYYLGKFLFEGGKELARAVGILRQVIIDEPNNNPAYYYLGQSIRSLIEKETLLEAERSLRIYLENGAEIGHEYNVWEFLNSIEEKKQSIKV